MNTLKQKKKEKRSARKNLDLLFALLMTKEKKALRKAREKKRNHKTGKNHARPGVKQWVLANKPKHYKDMIKLGLLKIF
jgi:hypothetical protein